LSTSNSFCRVRTASDDCTPFRLLIRGAILILRATQQKSQSTEKDSLTREIHKRHRLPRSACIKKLQQSLDRDISFCASCKAHRMLAGIRETKARGYKITQRRTTITSLSTGQRGCRVSHSGRRRTSINMFDFHLRQTPARGDILLLF